jgi:hypothetical protein
MQATDAYPERAEPDYDTDPFSRRPAGPEPVDVFAWTGTYGLNGETLFVRWASYAELRLDTDLVGAFCPVGSGASCGPKAVVPGAGVRIRA